MALLLLPLLLLLAARSTAASAAAAAQPLLEVETHGNGSFALSLDGTLWLRSAAPRLHVDGEWAALSLLPSAEEGTAAVWRWSITGPSGPAVWETSVSVDGRAAIFSQTFLEDLNGTAISGAAVLSSWPHVTAARPSLGYVMGAGMDGGSRAGTFNEDGGGNASSEAKWAGEQGGPLALFDSDITTLLVSPASEFMSTMMSGGSGVGDLAVGVSGSVTSVPSGHTVKTIMIAGRGIRDTFVAWGDHLMAMHAKARCGKRHLFLSFPYVCPEPVLVKCSFYIQMAPKCRFPQDTARAQLGPRGDASGLLVDRVLPV
jgi:hypothetical protein